MTWRCWKSRSNCLKKAKVRPERQRLPFSFGMLQAPIPSTQAEPPSRLTWFRRLRVDVGTIITFGVLGQAVLLISLGYWGAQQVVGSLANALHHSDHQRVQDQVQAFLDKSLAVARTMAAAPRLEPDGEGSDETAALLWSLLAEAPELDSVYVANDLGRMLQVLRYPKPAVRHIVRHTDSTSEHWAFKIGEDMGGHARDRYVTQHSESRRSDYNPLTRQWFIEASTQGRPIWSQPYVFHAAGELGVTYAVPRHLGSDQSQNFQVVSVDVSLGRLSDFVRQFNRGRLGDSALLSTEDFILARSDKDGKIDALKKPGQGILASVLAHLSSLDALDNSFQLRVDGELFLVQSSVISHTGWTLLSWVPEKSVLANVRKGLVLVFVAALFFLLLVLWMSLRMAHGITEPIEKLASNARQIGHLNLKNFKRVDSPLLELQHLDQALDESARGLAAFTKFVPVDVLGQLIDQGHGLGPGGKTGELTVMFVDVKRFSRLAENVPPEKLVPQLSAYFQTASEVISSFGGTIDKFLGDGILVLWGAPKPLAQAQLQACRAALVMQQAIDELNLGWQQQGQPLFEICIGIHSGPVVVGLFGSEDRLAYTALGDTVNVASRVEGLNRQLGTRILISQPVQQALQQQLPTRPMGSLELRGREERMNVWELLEPESKRLASNQASTCNSGLPK